jgi:thymidylate synthase ThyX
LAKYQQNKEAYMRGEHLATHQVATNEVEDREEVNDPQALAEVTQRYQEAENRGVFESINDYIGRDSETGELIRTPEGEHYLQQVVTDTRGDVYTFYPDNINPVIVAAAMARLSRCPHDMRNLILKEFSLQEGKEEDVLRRVVTQYGDDSVAQLHGGLPVVVENASNLLTKQLEWPRIGAYLEQSTRYIYFDQKVEGKYRYHTPQHLPEELQDTYEGTMDNLFDSYSHIVRAMYDHYAAESDTPESERDNAWRMAIRGKACDAARSLLPVATTATVGISSPAQSIDNLIMQLRSHDLPEMQEAGDQILEEVRKTSGIFFERTDMENRGEAITDHRRHSRQAMQQLGRAALRSYEQPETANSVEMADYYPANERDMVPYLLYTHAPAGLSLEDITRQVSQWSEEEQVAVLDMYAGERGNRRHKPGRAFEHAGYVFDVVCDYGAFRDLHRHRMVDGMEWQDLSPMLGHDIPEDIQAAGMAETYQAALDARRELYGQLVDAGYEQEAQYATLMGDKMRWKMEVNARAAFHLIELRTQPAGHPSYRRIANAMHEKISSVHPKIGELMIFVNQTDDDPAISREQQLRRIQAKARQLGLSEEDILIEE